MKLLLTAMVAVLSAASAAQIFYDDFEDGYIDDWEQCGYPGAEWWAEDGKAWCCSEGVDPSNTSILLAPVSGEYTDVQLCTSGSATHSFGLAARMDEAYNGVNAYVSPDADVARMRRIVGGYGQTILNSIYADFPSGVEYELTFTAIGDSLHLLIEVPSTGDWWELTAVDDQVHPGGFGMHCGDEPLGHWEYFEASGAGSGYIALVSFDVDDDNAGWSSGNGNGAFEAGEQIELGLALENNGGETLENAFGILQSLSPEISVAAGNCDYGSIAPGETAWPSPDFGLEAEASAPEDETYPFQLTVFADGGYSSVHEFDLPLGCGIEFDMEGDTGTWYTESLTIGWGDQWHQSGQRNHTPGGSESFKCGDAGYGDYDDELHSALVSPLFNMPEDATLSFWMWIDAQYVRADEAYDGGRLQIGQLGSWEDLQPSGGYPYQIVSGTTGPFEPGTGVWSGISGWQELAWEVPAELSGPRRLRWVFGSDESGTREGWYIDDLVVEGLQGIADDSDSPVPGSLHLTAAPNPFGSAVNISLSGLMPGEAAELEIFDLAGRKVFGRNVGVSEGGPAAVQWTGGSAGLYLVRARRGDDVRTLRVVRME